MELKGKTVIVTGAGRGLGKDISLRLAEQGCNLVLVARTEEQLEKVKGEIKGINRKAIIFPVDISEKGTIQRILEETINHFSSIDILINNAAVLYPSDFFDITEEQWDKTMNINLRATFLLSQKILKILVKQRSGYIINISSTAALEVPPGIAAYGISKLAMVGLTQAMYEVGKDFGVKLVPFTLV